MGELIKWTEKLSVNVKSIDEQHKKLIDLINQLHSAMSEGKGKQIIENVLEEMLKYTEYHFNYEEGLLKQTNYPEYEPHKKQHIHYVEKIKEFLKRYEENDPTLTVDVFFFLDSWLEEHIMNTDKKYSKHLNEHGIY